MRCLLLCTKNKFLAKSTLMSLLMKAGLSLNVFWQGTSKPLPCVDLVLRVRPWCRPQLFHVQDTLDLTLHLFGLAFFLEILFRVSK